MPFELTDVEYARLMALQKEFISVPRLPMEGEKRSYAVRSLDEKENFLLTTERKIVFELSKSKLNQTYAREPIFRVEFNGPPHQNPDGTIISRSHVHIYRAGYGMSWAYPLDTFDPALFKHPNNYNILFEDFCSYCNITNLESIQGVI